MSNQQPPFKGSFKVEIEIPGDKATKQAVEIMTNDIISKSTGKPDFSFIGGKVVNRVKILSRYLRVVKALDLE